MSGEDRAAPTEGAGEGVPWDGCPVHRGEVERVWRWFETDAAALRAERDALRDTVRRIEALCDRPWMLDGYGGWGSRPIPSVPVRDLRAALTPRPATQPDTVDTGTTSGDETGGAE